jgi:thioredoxin 1
MLATKLKHLETDGEIDEALQANERLMTCCGRMGPMCIPVYHAMENLEKQYPHVRISLKICLSAHLLWDCLLPFILRKGR